MRVPCCVIAGGEDPGSTPADMRLLAEQIRKRRLRRRIQ